MSKSKEEILRTALKLFRQKGYDQTTMRDIAREAGVALGAAYYYFRTKEELVLEFYAQTQEEAAKQNEEILVSTRSFADRVLAIFNFKLKQLHPYRNFISVLTRNALEPGSTVSPFSAATKEMREGAITLLAQAMEGSDLKVAPSLRPYLPKLFWFYQLGLILFWIHDPSPAQKQTQKLMEKSLAVLVSLLKFSTLPLLRRTSRSLVDILEILQALERAKA